MINIKSFICEERNVSTSPMVHMDTTIDHHTGSIHTYPTEALDMVPIVWKIVSSWNWPSLILPQSTSQLPQRQLHRQQQQQLQQQQLPRQQQVKSLTPQQLPQYPQVGPPQQLVHQRKAFVVQIAFSLNSSGVQFLISFIHV